MSDDPGSIEAWQQQMSNDIVARLRRIGTISDCEVAADEITRLRKALLVGENAYDILRLENEHLQTDRNNLALSFKKLEDKCKRLEVELGLYKRMYCRADRRSKGKA